MFIKHLKVLNNSENFLISMSILTMVIIFDYVFIEDHPDLVVDGDDDDDEISTNSDVEQFDNSDDGDEEEDDDMPTQQNHQLTLTRQQAMHKRKQQALQEMAIKPAFDLDNECEHCTR